MKTNLSHLDRITRIILASLFAYLYFSDIAGGTLGLVLVVLGAIFLFTGVIGFCPLYRAFNFSTYKG